MWPRCCWLRSRRLAPVRNAELSCFRHDLFEEQGMAQILKQGIPAAQTDAASGEVQATVASLIAEVKKGGDAAVRAISVRLDGWSPASFRLAEGEIDELTSPISKQH